MNPAQRLLLGAIVVIMAAGGYAAGRVLFRPTGQVSQPIVFSHQRHVEELDMECDFCHEFYADSEHSGLPTLTTCMGCHDEAVSEDPEEQKIRDLAAAGQDDVFRKLFRLPDHTFYSHRRHVTLGEIECETCHGSIAQTTVPPESPLTRIDMDFCIECHAQHQVSDDCTRCHS